jgi:hypothetical protein
MSDTQNLPSDALRTVQKGTEMLQKLIDGQKAELQTAMDALIALQRSLQSHLPLVGEAPIRRAIGGNGPAPAWLTPTADANQTRSAID